MCSSMISQLVPVEQLTDELPSRSEEHTSELQSQSNLVCRLLLEQKTLIFRPSTKPHSERNRIPFESIPLSTPFIATVQISTSNGTCPQTPTSEWPRSSSARLSSS